MSDSGLEYPRVLIVGQSFDWITGGGITLSNLFQGWPKDRLAVASDLKSSPDFTVCDRYYRLGSAEYHYWGPLAWFLHHRRVSGPVESAVPADVSEVIRVDSDDRWQTATGHVRRQDPLWRVIYSIDDLTGGGEALRLLNLSPQFLTWVKGFQPDIVYTQLASLNIIRLVSQLLKAIPIPLAVHIMDDWPSSLYRRKLLAPWLRRRTHVGFRDLIKQAAVLMGISAKMCCVYEGRYGRSFLPFHNSIDIAVWTQAAKRDWSASSPFRIMYRGRIGLAASFALRDVCDVVAGLHQAGHAVQLDIFTPQWPEPYVRSFTRAGCVFVHRPEPYSEVPRSLAAADLLVLPLDFDAESLRFIQYSMPTKVPEYMASATPVLVYAPAATAVSEYAREGQWGYVVSVQDRELLKSATLRLMGDPLLRETLGRRAETMATQNHDGARVREAFRQRLAKAVQQL